MHVSIKIDCSISAHPCSRSITLGYTSDLPYALVKDAVEDMQRDGWALVVITTDGYQSHRAACPDHAIALINRSEDEKDS